MNHYMLLSDLSEKAIVNPVLEDAIQPIVNHLHITSFHVVSLILDPDRWANATPHVRRNMLLDWIRQENVYYADDESE